MSHWVFAFKPRPESLFRLLDPSLNSFWNEIQFGFMLCVVWSEWILTEHTDGGLRRYLDISRHHILNGKTPAFLFAWNQGKTRRKPFQFRLTWIRKTFCNWLHNFASWMRQSTTQPHWETFSIHLRFAGSRTFCESGWESFYLCHLWICRKWCWKAISSLQADWCKAQLRLLLKKTQH